MNPGDLMAVPGICTYCGARLDAAVATADGRVICPNCKAAIAVGDVPSTAPTAQPVAPSADVQAIKQWIETASPAELDSLGQAVAQAKGDPRTKSFPYLMMLAAMPVAVVFIAAGISAVFTNEWDAVTGCFICGAGALAVLMHFMRGRWTSGRAIWTLTLLLIWSGASINVGLGKRVVLPFKPLEVEFAAFQPPGRSAAEAASPTPLRPKLFPLVIHSRGDRNQDPLPAMAPRHLYDIEIYKQLPPQLKPASLNEVHTVVLLDWGWTKRAESQDKNAGGVHGVYLGTCEIKVIDRDTRAVIAQTTLQSNKGPTSVDAGRLSSDWYGPQPSDKDVIAYLNALSFTPDK